MWLPVNENLPLRDFPLMVIVPERDPPESLPYVLLGAQFLLEYRVSVHLSCGIHPGSGKLEIP
jgi:hypothetical protein